MSVQNVLFGSGKGNQEIDVIDIAALVLIPIASALIFGVWSWNIEVFGGYDFTAPLWSIGSYDITAALLIVVGGVSWISATNLANKRTDMGDYEFAATVTALLLPILYVFIPVVADLVTWHDMMRLAATLYVSVAAVYISYRG